MVASGFKDKFMREFISRLFNGIYSYRETPSTLGVGVENMALRQPGLAISMNYYAPKYNVRGDLGPWKPGYVKYYQDMPFRDLRADGVYMSGDLALAALSEMANENK